MLKDLATPRVYPPPQPRRVDVVTTHISWVFLADDWVYKVKRPVHFAFCDFSTMEKRRQACEEELRVNRWLAPDVYRDVVPVFHGQDGYSFTAQAGAKVVDHAVRMRRLDDADSARALLQAGRLGAPHLQCLANRLAEFYAQAPAIHGPGTPEHLRQMIATNLDEIRTLPSDNLISPVEDRTVAHLLDAVAEGCDRIILQHQNLLERRCREGQMREGHGDLRLEHVYFQGGAPDAVRVIDAIEFNRDFRLGDVALDVAFLAMELDGAKRPDLASWFLNMVARARDDYGFYPIVDVYLAHRALVRAKVAALLAMAAGIPADRAARKRAEAQSLLAQAVGYLRPRTGPQVVVCVGGMIGSGKSTLAEGLALAVGFPVVASDHTRKHLAGLPVDQKGPAAIYSEDFTRRTLDRMMDHAASVLVSGRSVILDATFRDPVWRQAARDLAGRHGVAFLLVQATASESTLRQRLRARDQSGARSVSDAREPLLDQFLERDDLDQDDDTPADMWCMVNTDQPPAACVSTVCARLALLGIE